MVFANTEVEARTLIQSTHPDMNKLIDQGLKDIESVGELSRRNMIKLWLEKMYIRGNINALAEMHKIYKK